METDQTAADVMEEDIEELCAIIASVKGWTPKETAKICFDNANRVFSKKT
jgi:Tat protein secretion system quality control protein TatD with DNase activity